jgi:hypothetical protein
MSLVFMLIATTLLWASATRLFDSRTAFFTTALWATLASTEFLGAFATYDALALLLMATSAWCAVRAAEHRKALGWLTVAALTLSAANATKYASIIFDPVVVGIAIFVGMRYFPWRHALARGATLFGITLGMLLFLCAVGGHEYITGFTATTLLRPSSTNPASQVIGEAWGLTAPIIVLSIAGAMLCFLRTRDWSQRLLITLMAVAALLVPLEQARIHTTDSLQKHVDFGAWFGAIAAGYLISLVISKTTNKGFWRASATATCVTALALPVLLGVTQARERFADWPSSVSLIDALRPVVGQTDGPVLVSSPNIPEYYLPEGSQWWRWSNLYTLRLLDGHALTSGIIGKTEDASFYQRAIRAGFFSVIVINKRGSQAAMNERLLRVVQQNSHYQLATSVRYWDSQIWIHRPNERVRFHLASSTATPIGGLLFPAARLNPLLGAVTFAVVGSGFFVIIFTLIVRLAWRHHKAVDEL